MEDDPGAGRAGGPIPVYRAPLERWGPVDRALRDAALAAGYKWNPDLNAPDGEGVSCYPINSHDGRRITTNEAFLEPARGRANLDIGGAVPWWIACCCATAGQSACGCAWPARGWTESPPAKYLLCAGAIHSPGYSDALRHRLRCLPHGTWAFR